jgi:hypothetical protein
MIMVTSLYTESKNAIAGRLLHLSCDTNASALVNSTIRQTRPLTTNPFLVEIVEKNTMRNPGPQIHCLCGWGKVLVLPSYKEDALREMRHLIPRVRC